jgi:hypothetical protein
MGLAKAHARIHAASHYSARLYEYPRRDSNTKPSAPESLGGSTTLSLHFPKLLFDKHLRFYLILTTLSPNAAFLD